MIINTTKSLPEHEDSAAAEAAGGSHAFPVTEGLAMRVGHIMKYFNIIGCP